MSADDEGNTRFMARQVKMMKAKKPTDREREFGISDERLKLIKQRSIARQTNT